MTRIVVRMLVSAACIAAAMMPVTHAAADDKDICNSRAADDQAIAACNRLIDSGRYQGRDLVTAYLNRGAKWSMKGDHDRAIADYDEMIRLDPKISQAYNNRGISWRAKGNLDRATADFSQAIGLDPTLPQAYQNRATVWRAIGDHDRAIGDLDRAIALGPDNAEAYNDRGASWRAKGDMTRAIADLDRAIKLDPKSAKAYTERGGIWLAKRDNERAFADFDQAIKLNPNLPLAYNGRGVIWSIRGDSDPAIADFDRAIRLFPRFADAFGNRGYAKFFKGDFDASAADFLKVIEIDPNQYTLLWRFMARGRVGQNGADELSTASGRLKSKEWPYALIEFYVGRRSLEDTRAAAKSPGEQCEAAFYIGEWQLLRGNRLEAQEELRKATADTCPRDFIEYKGAVAELKRLDR